MTAAAEGINSRCDFKHAALSSIGWIRARPAGSGRSGHRQSVVTVVYERGNLTIRLISWLIRLIYSLLWLSTPDSMTSYQPLRDEPHPVTWALVAATQRSTVS